jgi:hypothetical protein
MIYSMSATPQNVLNYHVRSDGVTPFFQLAIPFILMPALPLVAIGFVACLGATTLPVTCAGLVFLGLMSFALGGLLWLIAILGCRREFRRSKIRTFLATPILMVLLFALPFTDLPRESLFYVNKPALDHFANQWMAMPNHPTSGRAGVYVFYEITPIPGGFVAYVVGANGMGLRGALAYCPKSPPQTNAGNPTPAGGGWYYMWCDTD